MIFAPRVLSLSQHHGTVVDAVRQANAPCLSWNSETVPHALLTGDDAIYPVQYFPTILAKRGTKPTLLNSPADVQKIMLPATASGVSTVDEPSVNPYDNLF